MKLHAAHVAALAPPRQTSFPCVVAATQSAGDRRRVRVREVRPACRRDTPSSSADGRVDSSEFQPTCGTLTTGGSRAALARQARRARAAGASSLPSNSHCSPRQMPSSGTPSRDAPSNRAPPRRRRATRSPRNDRRLARRCRAPRASSDAAAGVKSSAPDRREALAHRGQIARASSRSSADRISQSSPFVLGITFASRRSREHAIRSARPNALNSASTL